MKVIINKNTYEICDEVPNIYDVDSPYILEASNYTILDVDNCFNQDGSFRELTVKEKEKIQFNFTSDKNKKEYLVSQLEVEYKGIVYQADEESQNRLNRVLNSLPNDTIVTEWKAKDNNIQYLNKVDLKEILFRATTKQTKIWIN